MIQCQIKRQSQTPLSPSSHIVLLCLFQKGQAGFSFDSSSLIVHLKCLYVMSIQSEWILPSWRSTSEGEEASYCTLPLSPFFSSFLASLHTLKSSRLSLEGVHIKGPSLLPLGKGLTMLHSLFIVMIPCFRPFTHLSSRCVSSSSFSSLSSLSPMQQSLTMRGRFEQPGYGNYSPSLSDDLNA